jgi:parallel beta-helix repeat protein
VGTSSLQYFFCSTLPPSQLKQICGTTAASRNVISGNGGAGLFIVVSSNNKVLGNRIGTTVSGTVALGNDAEGVFIADGSNNSVGDGTSGGSNTIAFNGGDGIAIFRSTSTGNAISRNSIFSNAGLGIDLIGGFEDATGKTANDPGDIDDGSNGLQNFPGLTSAKSSSTTTTISATLNSTPTKTFRVQFFSNPSGNEGKKFIGQKSVTTNGSGSVSFTFSPASKVAVGQTITATATDTSNNTSEFSAPRTVASS